MNVFLPSVYDEMISRLALGIEAVDAVRDQPVIDGLALAPDGRAAFRKPFQTRSGGRFALLYDKVSATATQEISLRLTPTPQAARRFVPRRFRITVPSLVLAEAEPPFARVARPRMYPGAAYPLVSGTTGMRGRVERTSGGPRRPARWTRVVATIPATEPNLNLANIVGRGFGDDRGEFVLALSPGAASGTPSATLRVRISVFAQPVEPPPPAGGTDDPLWDAPVEHPVELDDADRALLGTVMPAGWSSVATRQVNLRLGRVQENAAVFEF